MGVRVWRTTIDNSYSVLYVVVIYDEYNNRINFYPLFHEFQYIHDGTEGLVNVLKTSVFEHAQPLSY